MQIDITMKDRVLIPSIALVLLMLVAGGCDSFLEPEPESFQTTANFYQTPGHFEQAINGVYVQTRNLFGDEWYRNVAERRGPTLTEHFDVNLPRTVSGHPQIEEWEVTPGNPAIDVLWQQVYDVVKEANVVLSRIEEVEFEGDPEYDADDKNRIIGEALTQRALAYWLAAQTWGDVPLLLEEPGTPDDAATIEGGRAPVEEVYGQIIADLQEVVDNGYLPVSYSGGQVGKVTDGAARFLLGRTYLLTEDYQEALTQFEALDDGRYRLLDDYREIFNPGNKNNDETIFELQYNPDIAGQSGWDPGVIGVYSDILPITATRDDLIPEESNAFVPEGTMMPTPDVIMSYEEGDARFDASIAWHVHPDNSGSPEIAWPVRTENSAAGDSIAYLYKYYWPDQVDDSGEGLNNWVVFRFADVLLSAAEAHWRLGSTGEAETYLNRVRARADLDPFDASTFDSFIIGDATGDPLGNAILHERAIELLGEGHFWLDAKRFGPNVAQAVFEPYAERYRARAPRVQDVYVFQERGLLFPIPTREVDLGDLEQTPGW